MAHLFFNKFVTKGLTAKDSNERFFEGILTVQMVDKQNEITIVDELLKVLPIWIDRGAPISDTHSNRIVGRGINYAKTVVVDKDGTEYPAISITGKIFKNYKLDDQIWDYIKTGKYKGLSFGGATKSDRTPVIQKDGSVAYSLKDLEHYEVAVCAEPAVPLALIVDYNPIAKAIMGDKMVARNDGKALITCDKFGCYVDKADESIKDPTPAIPEIVNEQKEAKIVPPNEVLETTNKEIGTTLSAVGEKPGKLDVYVDPTVVDGDEKDKKKEFSQVQGGVRTGSGYDNSRTGPDPGNDSAQITESVDEDDKEGKMKNYIKEDTKGINNGMTEQENKPIEKQVEATPVDSKILDAIASVADSVKKTSEKVDSFAAELKTIGEKVKAMEKPTDLPIKPAEEDKEDIGAKVKVPDTYQSNSQQASIRDSDPKNEISSDPAGLKMQEKSAGFVIETPRPVAAVETVNKSAMDYSQILNDARSLGFEGLSIVAKDILAGKYYTPSEEERGLTW